LKPLHSDFESAGVIASLRRLFKSIPAKFNPPLLPRWLLKDRIQELLGSEHETGRGGSGGLLAEARTLAGDLYRVEVELRGGASKCTRGPATEPMANPVVLARIVLGSLCETQAAQRASRGSIKAADRSQAAVQRLKQDSLNASVWTSCHVLYISGFLQDGLAPASPSIHLFPSELTELDLSDVYARRLNPKSLKADCAHLVALLVRCTNPGTRGWDSTTKAALSKSDGVCRVCIHALVVSLCGMTSFLCPTKRPRWTDRHAIFRTLSTGLSALEFKGMALEILVPFKEVVRRMAANCVMPGLAALQAMGHAGAPLASLRRSPLHSAHAGLEESCALLARAGERLASGEGVVECITGSFADCGEWVSSYLGKGYYTPPGAPRFVSLAAEIWSSCFRCNFTPLWAHYKSHGIRASRLDSTTHGAVHALNAATALTNLLSDAERMGAGRAALQRPSAALMGIEQVAAGGGRGAARMLAFGKAAWASEHVMVYELGPRTARLQAAAVLKRLMLTAPEGSDPVQEVLRAPEHARALFCCLDCKRVANACAGDGGFGWAKSFTELGTCISMLSSDDEGRCSLGCSKRSSASLRTAMVQEEEVSNLEVESMPVRERDIDAVGGKARDTLTSARVRRDARCTMGQVAVPVPCGAQNMLKIDAIGKAVCVFGSTYALCSLCGCFVEVSPSNRCGAEICCLRCDFRMLNRNAPAAAVSEKAAPQCRFCGKTDPLRAGSRWKACRAPMDTSGANAALPPPLRVVYFCPSHFRSWISACLKVLPTRVILSHIVHGARPVFGLADEGEGRLKQKPPPKRRRLGLKG
jgi:hypothetical protein